MLHRRCLVDNRWNNNSLVEVVEDIVVLVDILDYIMEEEEHSCRAVLAAHRYDRRRQRTTFFGALKITSQRIYSNINTL